MFLSKISLSNKAILIGMAFVVLIVLGLSQLYLNKATYDWHWQLPDGFPEPFVPVDNPMSEVKFQLGRHLFYDKRLSGNGTMACASCHLQHLAFTDGRDKSIGSTGEKTDRGAMSLVNVAYFPTLTWANPSLTLLERQAMVPLFTDNLPVEMGIDQSNQNEVLRRITQDTLYQRMFKDAFPEVTLLDFSHIIKAIATFERGMISANAKFDKVRRGEDSFTPIETTGKTLFYGKAQCAQCHSGLNFSDQFYAKELPYINWPFHNTGLYNIDGKGAYPSDNQGLVAVIPGDRNMGKFRTQALRNIALTAPYMHDGSIATLEEVLDHYARHGRAVSKGDNQGDGKLSPLKDPILDKVEITEEDKPALIAFLKTLTDESLLTNPRFSDPFIIQQK